MEKKRKLNSINQIILFSKDFKLLFFIWGILRSRVRERRTKLFTYSFNICSHHNGIETNQINQRMELKAANMKDLAEKLVETQEPKATFYRVERFYK